MFGNRFFVIFDALGKMDPKVNSFVIKPFKVSLGD